MNQPASRLAIGTVQFGQRYGIANRDGQVSRDEAARVLEYAWSAGLNTLDTAVAYGESEQRLGEIGVRQWRVVTKLPPLPEPCADVAGWVEATLAASLSRLRIDRLAGVLLHRPQQLLGEHGQALYAALQTHKRAGVVAKIGVSIYSPDELDALTAAFRFDLVQAPFNVFDRRLLTTGWLARLEEAGVETHGRSVFLQGLLLMDAARRPPYFQRWDPLWQRWHEWLAAQQVAPLRVSLLFALARPEIDRVVVGVDRVEQLQDIVAVAGEPWVEPPVDLQSTDVDLINPSKWM